MVKEGSSDYTIVRKRWFFKEPLTECFFVNQKWFFYGIAVKNLLSTFIFKSVQNPYIIHNLYLIDSIVWLNSFM